MAEHNSGGMSNLLTLGLVAVGGFFLYEWLFGSSATAAPTTSSTPGTTTTMNQGGGQTSVSTSPASTVTLLQSIAANMVTKMAGVTSATADQWNSAFSAIFGQGIDSKYNLSFDAVYGPLVNGQRNNGATMSAMDFLQQAAVAKGGLPGLNGLGAFVRYPGVPVRTMGSMVYAQHHPLPHGVTTDLRRFRGLGAPSVANGFERALFGQQRLGRNKLIF